MLKSIGEKIYTSRLARGLTQSELVKKTGIPQPNLSNIEKGKRDITLTTFLKLAGALDVSPADLLTPLIGTKDKHAGLTRSKAERLAKAAVRMKSNLSPAEQKIAEYLRTIVPLPGKKSPGKIKVYRAWLALKEIFNDNELKTCIERVRDELMRNQWTLNS